MAEPSRLGVRVKRLRERKGWTQQQLSDQSGVNRVTIANLEAGRRASVTIENGAKLASALGVTLDRLAGDPLDDEELLAASTER